MKIALTAITKGDSEVKLFERMLKSFMPQMDGLYVAITGFGKKSATKKLIEQYNGKWVVTSPETHPKIYLKDENGDFFANFAEARNVTLGMFDHKEYDFWTWADSDDVLGGATYLKELAQRIKDAGGDAGLFTYWYAVRQNPDGTIKDVTHEHVKQRLLTTAFQWKWISRLHEVMVPKDENYQPKMVEVTYNPKPGGTQTVWVHLPTEAHYIKNLSRNIRILEKQVEEEEFKDPRTIYSLAKTYVTVGMEDNDDKLAKAEEYLNKYLEMSGWAEERCFACHYLGQIHNKQGKIDEAIKDYHRAIEEHPISQMSYLWLASLYGEKGMWEQSDHWLNVVLKLPAPSARSTIGEPLAIRQMAVILKYNQALRHGNLKEAIEYRKKWNQVDGRKDEGDELLEELQDNLEANDAATWLHNYAVYLKKHDNQQQLEKLMEAVTPDFRNEPFFQKLRSEVLPGKEWPKKSIVYMAASSFAPWNAKTALQEGVGGSETAIIMLTKEWAKMGYKVAVYANVTEECEVDGVEFKHWSGINIKDKFDNLVIWRNPLAIDQPWQANKLLYDAHDVEAQTNWTVERMARIDKVFFKSKFHRSMVPQLPESKVRIISNGVCL